MCDIMSYKARGLKEYINSAWGMTDELITLEFLIGPRSEPADEIEAALEELVDEEWLEKHSCGDIVHYTPVQLKY